MTRLKTLHRPGSAEQLVCFTSAKHSATSSALVDDSAENGWISIDEHLPQDFVFAFHRDHIALIDKVIINPAAKNPATQAKTVAFYVSSDSPLDGFQEAGRVAIAQEPGYRSFPWAGRPAT